MPDRREFLWRGVTGGIGAALVTSAMVRPAAAQTTSSRPGGRSESLLAPRPDHPQAATFDRLDEQWYKGAIRRLQAELQETGIDAVLLTDR
jgi:hypothetical protein